MKQTYAWCEEKIYVTKNVGIIIIYRVAIYQLNISTEMYFIISPDGSAKCLCLEAIANNRVKIL